MAPIAGSRIRFRKAVRLELGADRAGCPRPQEGPVSLIVWLPAMFLLGLTGMALCLAFLSACDKI